jgi:putative sterol carrier protein
MRCAEVIGCAGVELYGKTRSFAPWLCCPRSPAVDEAPGGGTARDARPGTMGAEQGAIAMTEILSDAWAKAWGEALNGSATYRAVAASWEGAVLVTARADPARGVEERSAFLDLHHGTCREARAGRAGDLEAVRYALVADAQTWLGLLSGTLDPMSAVMGGALDLAKGGVTSLLPQLAAARELVAVARSLDGTPPRGWVAS